MATTTNYGWTTPDDTALVKDGASAIRTLGSSIDTSLNNALGTKKAGLVLLNTTSFSAVASQSVNDVFSATYDNYKIIIAGTNASSDSFNFRLRVSGTDSTGSDYWYAQSFIVSNSGTQSATIGENQTSFNFQEFGQAGALADIEIANVFKAQATMLTYNVSSSRGTSAGAQRAFMGTGSHEQATSYTGFTFFSPVNMTGSVSVYGYNK